ncbi:AfsR/SARP family transcriptional regulator [Kribbella sp. VKM Ac-2568]|uniref:AfsR/SARP family transcriptional regulator n=1 Tax=Kribbella sp. VKM Ac-2568 TaxID=2512219 RepID=UPI00104DEC45|nr:AfsR/SARP family transcriptional regulator [Kribbella sp. VKM Ac-2568]TCM38620.1 transcriptional regulator [Kribbella sp. VKM Ac-2568]
MEVLDADGGLVQLGGQKQRALLGLLIASGGRVVPVSRLVDELWGEDPPPKVLVSVQSYVANLRRVLEPDRAARAPARVIVTQPPGYSLAAAELDVVEFEELVSAGREALATDPGRAGDLLRAAASLWRGDPYADLTALAPALAAEAARLVELSLLATEDRFRADLASGHHKRVVGEIEQLAAAHPLRESAWGLLAVALYRSQRQGAALDALRRARRILADELGVDPGPELRRLEKAILDQEPTLDASPRAARTTAPAPATATSRPGGGDHLVGREEPLTRLAGLLVEATAGRGNVVLITGEPGIGKTGLARALTATAAAMGLNTGWGRCEETAGAPPFWPWSQALASLIPTADDAARARTPLASLIPDPAAEVLDANTAVFRLAEAAAGLLRAAGPTLLVLDDLHRADGDTLRLVGRLGLMATGLPVLLVLTSRDAEADITPEVAEVLAELARAELVRIGLRGLDETGIRTYARLHHDIEIPETVAAALARRTNGNPFFVGELIRLLADQRQLTESGAAELRVPDGVRDVVRQRIAQLPDEVERLLEAAAAYGAAFDADLVEEASGLTAAEAVAATEAALLAGLIVADGPDLRFTHALVREAVYVRLPLGRRRELHAAIAGLLEQRTGRIGLAELAHHYGEAGPDHARAAWTYAVRASELAARQSAPAEAARLQDLALTSVSRDRTASATDRYDVLLGLARARKRAGQEIQAWAAAREAAEVALEAGDVVAAATAAVAVTTDAIWSWREYLVVDFTGVALFERLLRELPPGHEVVRARLLAALAAEIYYQPDTVERAVALSTEAESLARRYGSPEDLARILELRHLAYERPELLGERLSAARELLDLAEAADDPVAVSRALVFRGRDQLEQGEVAAGLRDYQRARGLAETYSLAPVLVTLVWADAVVAVGWGRFDDAERAIETAAEFHAGTTLAGAASLPVALAATLGLARGTLAAIEPMLAEAAALSGLALLREWHALALVRAGRIEEAGAALGPWHQQPEVPPDYLWLTHLAIRAELWSALGSAEAARELYAQLAPYEDRVVIGGTGITIAGFAGHQVGLLARTVGELDLAVDHLQTALDRNESAELWPFAAATARELATTLRQRDRPGDRQTAAAVEARGAGWISGWSGRPVVLRDESTSGGE